ncbi:MAG: toll/interleukin receptor protein [Xanthobacteraceae bacterium]|nr:toll/interleukin receptor protein [Xanthobacteraceae bacterium]
MVTVFISYAHSDEKLKDQLVMHLAALRREGIVGVWHDRMLKPGEHLDHAIEAALAASDLIILVISPAFIASDYCSEREMVRAFERAARGEAKVVALILRPCRWQNVPLMNGSKLGDFLAVPKDGKPIITWSVLDEAFDDAVTSIRSLILDSNQEASDPSIKTIPATVVVQNTPTSNGGNPVRGVRSSFRLPRRFTDLDKDTFVDDAFEVMALTFKENLLNLEQENDQVRTRFQRVDALCFTSSVYVEGNMAGGAKVFRGGISRQDNNSVYLSYDLSSARNGHNEWLSVETDSSEIYFKAGGMPRFSGRQREDQKMDAEQAAKYLWSTLIEQIESRIG